MLSMISSDWTHNAHRGACAHRRTLSAIDVMNTNQLRSNARASLPLQMNWDVCACVCVCVCGGPEPERKGRRMLQSDRYHSSLLPINGQHDSLIVCDHWNFIFVWHWFQTGCMCARAPLLLGVCVCCGICHCLRPFAIGLTFASILRSHRMNCKHNTVDINARMHSISFFLFSSIHLTISHSSIRPIRPIRPFASTETDET